MSINVAIDGPAGAGKSTIARNLAQNLGYIYVDTGAMYRAMTLYMLEHHIDTEDEKAVADACPDIEIKISYEKGEQCVYLNGVNVNGRIRTEEVSRMTSRVSALPVVREKLLDLQRSLAASENVIMDGRDIGTNVFPDAQYKFYLTADAEERARRRWKELKEKGQDVELSQILQDIHQRDYADTHRELNPLMQAEDAELVDSTSMTIDEVVKTLVDKIQGGVSGRV